VRRGVDDLSQALARLCTQGWIRIGREWLKKAAQIRPT